MINAYVPLCKYTQFFDNILHHYNNSFNLLKLKEVRSEVVKEVKYRQ